MKGKRKIRLVLGLLLTILMVMPGGMIKADEAEAAPPPAEETVALPEEEVSSPIKEASEPVVEEPAPQEGAEEPEVIIDVVSPEVEVLPVIEPEAETLPPPVEDPVVEVPPAEEPKAEEIQEPPLVEVMSPTTEDPLDEEVSNFEALDGDYKWGEDVRAEGTGYDDQLGWGEISLFTDASRGGSHHIRYGVIEINKVWLADKNAVPKAVAFKLLADGKQVGILPILKSRDWKTKLVVPIKIGEKVISYSIVEMKVPGFESTVQGMTITNQQMRYLSVKKVWMGDEKPEEKYDFRPESVTYQLKANGMVVGGVRTLTEDKGWKEFIKVPAYDAKGKIRYEVIEEKLEGYDSKYKLCEHDVMSMEEKHHHDGECADIMIMNIFNNKKDITLTKMWVDNNNPERPGKVMFNLYRDGKHAKVVNVFAQDNWKAVESVSIFDRVWNKIKYTIDEKHVPEGYKAYVDGLTITNKLIEMVEIKGEKFWWDNGQGRPKSIEVTLMAGHKAVKTLKVTPVDGKWLYDFGKYPKYDHKDKLIEYTLKEVRVKGYKSYVEGFNLYNQKWDLVPVRKIWKDDWKIKDVRPDMVKYQLLADGVVYGGERMLSKNKGWKDSVYAPAYDAEGKIEYTVKEVTVPLYDTTYKFCTENDVEAARGHKHDEKCEILIINTFKNEKEITLTKIWDDNNNKWRPREVTFHLYQNDDFYKKVEMKKENSWVEKLVVPVYDKYGKPYNYRIEEKQVPRGYEVSVDGLTITNKLKMPEMVEIKGEKFWWDNGQGRPKSIEVTLMAGHKAVKTLKVTPVDGKWLYDFGKYPKYDHKDKLIEYTLKELDVKGYKSYVEGFNLYNQKWDEVPVRKIWKDDWKIKDVRPDMVKYQLLADGVVYGGERMLSKNEGWKDSVYAPAYDAEGKIEYTVKEVTVPLYDTTYKFCTENDVEAARGHKHNEKCEILIINTFKNEKHLEMKKIWDDNESEDRPEEVTFILYQNDKEFKEVLITEEEEWMAHLSVKLYDRHGKLYTYKISEKLVPEGYEATVLDMTITNKLMKEAEMVEIKGEKTWLDDGTGRPGFIMVKLMANDELKETKKVMPVEGKWLYDFGKMAKFDDEDEPIVYTIQEEPVDGYEFMAGEGFDIVNRRVEMTLISGEKTWDDLMNRPSEITVYLHRNGESFKEMVVKPDEEGKWLYAFKELDKFDDMGKPYVYTLSEKKILFYDAHVTGYDIHNYQQRATLVILKVNKNDVVLPGAVFEIYDVMGKLLKTATTGADGTIKLVLPLGAYRIKELSPPAGYEKTDKTALAMLLKDGDVVTVEIENEFLEFDDVSPKPLPETPMTPTLPSTGGAGGNFFYLLGMASIAFGLFSLKRKKA